MKLKQKVDVVINSLLVIIGIVIVILSIFGFNNVGLVLVVTMGLYSILNLVQFILTREHKDYEGLYTSFASAVVGGISYYFSSNGNHNLGIIVMAWVTIMAVIKFIKSDYYNDRRDKMWQMRIFSLLLFIVLGVITTLSLNYFVDSQVVILGYFFFVHGILELFDPLTKYLMQG